MSTNLKILFGAVIVLVVVGIWLGWGRTTLYQPKSSYNQPSDIEIQRGIVRLDVQDFKHLSDTVKYGMILSIDSASVRYNVPPILLHAIFRIESEYRFEVTHPTVSIRVKGKQVTTNAIGLGGIIWEVWEDLLKERKIAYVKSDLYRYEVNIEATAFIIRRIVDENCSNANIRTILPTLISRYYGQFDKNYEQKMKTFTSELFWKRISRDLVQTIDSVKAR